VQPEIKKLQIFLRPTLNGKEEAFCKELWDLMLSAQESDQGVPPKLLEAKKLQLKQDKVCPLAVYTVLQTHDMLGIQSCSREPTSRATGAERDDRHVSPGRAI
jgi:hypothetical protein